MPYTSEPSLSDCRATDQHKTRKYSKITLCSNLILHLATKVHPGQVALPLKHNKTKQIIAVCYFKCFTFSVKKVFIFRKTVIKEAITVSGFSHVLPCIALFTMKGPDLHDIFRANAPVVL